MKESVNLTDAQVGARDKAWELLKEHFEHVIVCYDTEVVDGTDRAFECNYHGGITTAIGLCERAKMDMKERGKESE